MSGVGDLMTETGLGPATTVVSDRILDDVIRNVRMYTRDYPELNRLVRGVESDSRFIAFAIYDAISDWNTSPPHIGQVTSVANHPSIHLLVRKAAICLLESIIILKMRNHLSYTDGQGASVNASSNYNAMLRFLQYLDQRYMQQRDKMKIALNIEGGWGTGVFSEIVFTSGYYGF